MASNKRLRSRDLQSSNTHSSHTRSASPPRRVQRNHVPSETSSTPSSSSIGRWDQSGSYEDASQKANTSSHLLLHENRRLVQLLKEKEDLIQNNEYEIRSLTKERNKYVQSWDNLVRTYHAMKEQLKAYKTDIEEFERENERLQKDSRTSQTDYEEHISHLTETNEKLEGQVKEYRVSNSSLVKENKTLKDNITKISDENEKTKNKVKQLEKQLYSTKESFDHVTEENNDVTRLRQENDTLSKQVRGFERNISSLNHEKEKLTKQITVYKDDLQEANSKIKELQIQVDKSRKELYSVRGSKETIIEQNKKCAKLDEQVKQLQSELSTTREELDIANTKVTSLNEGQSSKQSLHARHQLSTNTDTTQMVHYHLKEISNFWDSMVKEKQQLSVELGATNARVVEKSKEKNKSLKREELEKWKNMALQSEKTVSEMNGMMKSKDHKISDLSHRLASEMSVKVSANETSIENVSIKVRPTKVAEEYSNVCSGQWLTAKTEIDTKGPKLSEVEKLNFLSDIFMIAQNIAKDMHNALLEDIQKLLLNPLKSDDHKGLHETKAQRGRSHSARRADKRNEKEDERRSSSAERKRFNGPLTDQVTNALGDFLRNTSESAHMGPLVEAIEAQLNRQHTLCMLAMNGTYSTKMNTDLLKYISACANLTWKIVIQRPQMEFRTEQIGSKYNEVTQEINWGSDPPEESIIVCYAYPTLYHSTTVMTKGKVLLKKVSKRKPAKQYYGQTTV